MGQPPHDAASLRREFGALAEAGRHDEILARCRELLETAPGDPAVLDVTADQLALVGELGEARRALESLHALRPQDPGILNDIAALAQQTGDLAGSEAAADRILAIAPGHPGGVAMKGEAMYLQGRYREAFEYLAPIARAPGAHVAVLIVFARVSRVIRKEWQAISLLRQALEEPTVHHEQALIEGGFALGSLLEGVGKHEEAWAAVSEANARKATRFDPAAFEAGVERMLAAWTPDAVGSLPAAEPTRLPVLIVGMPRSGTTLVEQILASHGRVSGGGELPHLFGAVVRLSEGPACVPPILESPAPLTAEVVESERERYLSVLRAAGDDAPRVTDKLPTNALHLGLVRAIAPGSRVIWCRRDPMDTCVSCYFHSFGGANEFAYDLEHLGRFHVALDRVMRHWEAALGLEILEVPYEELVADQEGWTRRLVEFVGLPWDAACLRYHESDRAALTLSNAQVRQPIFTSSIERWRSFEEHLGPLRRALGA